MLWSIDSCQNRVSADQYHLSVSRAHVPTHRGRDFFEVIRWHVTIFQMIVIHMKYVAFMSRTMKITSNFYALIGHNLTGEFKRKIYAASWNLFTLVADSWSRGMCQLLSRVFCYSWQVCLMGFWLRNTSLVIVGNPIWDRIVFVFHLAWCATELKSLKRFWPYLIASRGCILNGKPE